MNILFVHQSFPGQYRHIVHELSKRTDTKIVALAIEAPSEPLPESVQYVRYQPFRGSSREIHPWCRDFESKIIRGEACARAALSLKNQGFTPDLICAHPGWGEALFLKDIWRQTPLLTYQEFYYQSQGFDTGFDPEFEHSANENEQFHRHSRIRAKTANTLVNLQASDWCVTPTEFQKSTFPIEWHHKFSVIHDGIDTNAASPERPAKRICIGGKTLDEKMPIVTFVNRRLEPYRGAHTFLRSIPEIQRAQPNCHIIIVGATKGTSYGSACPEGEWKDYLLRTVGGNIDHDRLHFTGSLRYATYLDLLRISSVHVYLTYPFVLSWSLLEAMSFGKAVVGSNTMPVMEMIKHEHNGLIVDFFSPGEVADAVARLLNEPETREILGREARKLMIQKYCIRKCLPKQLALLELVADRAL